MGFTAARLVIRSYNPAFADSVFPLLLAIPGKNNAFDITPVNDLFANLSLGIATE